MPLLLDSSDEEYTFNTEESEGFRLINEKNLSTAVSKAYVCEKGTLTLEEDKKCKSGGYSFPFSVVPVRNPVHFHHPVV